MLPACTTRRKGILSCWSTFVSLVLIHRLSSYSGESLLRLRCMGLRIALGWVVSESSHRWTPSIHSSVHNMIIHVLAKPHAGFMWQFTAHCHCVHNKINTHKHHFSILTSTARTKTLKRMLFFMQRFTPHVCEIRVWFGACSRTYEGVRDHEITRKPKNAERFST